MKKSKVYFTDFRTAFYGEGILQKLERLMKKAGFEEIGFQNRFTAVKLHFGEAGNLAYLRPQYARTVADYVKKLGGIPFLTDCNTLYAGSRKNAVEHLATAAMNGFSEQSAHCPILIGDGLKGNDEIKVSVPNGIHFKEAKIGRTIMDADIFISLTHFKGHEKMGIGGCVKNIGMGCASCAGKMELHSDGKPVAEEDVCTGCGKCIRYCAHGALKLTGGKMHVDHVKCTGCGSCVSICPVTALQPTWRQADRLLDEKTAEYASAVVAGRPHFHISILNNISPNCDCHGENDAPILPDIGMLASFDPVALDLAACELCNKAPRLVNTWLDGKEDSGDVFNDAHKNSHWKDTLDHAVKIGLGNDNYELIRL
ncbi:MAG: DUF362 domain-containing protein [Lentisphaeria bacterium]|nr:DUF362 domain-containing protein [Lentisphaeria bacterium]